jgi:Domain of unknown function DUF29
VSGYRPKRGVAREQEHRMSGNLADYRVDIERVSTGKRADSITTRAASEDEARRNAEDEIRHSSTPNDLRVATITYLASARLAGEGAMSANAEVVQLYDTDIAAWAEQQALALRRRAANEIDWDNVAEEIEDLAARQKREVRRRLRIICEHLLKWRHWIRTRTSTRPLNGWRVTLVEQRRQLTDLLGESPSLRTIAHEALPQQFVNARQDVEQKIGESLGLPDDTCLWSLEQVLARDFFPRE